MGQRTQILVIKENNKGEVKKTLWHHQWGFGRNMYLALMSLYIADYSKDTWDKDYDFFNTSFPTIPKLYDITDEVSKETLDAADINSLASIRRVFDVCDNNNGGMVVHITENGENYLQSHFKVGFLMGYEDEYSKSMNGMETYNLENIDQGKAFDRWLTPVEYGHINGGRKYSDPNFMEIVYKFCDYFGIESIKNNKSVEENEKEYQEYKVKVLSKKTDDSYVTDDCAPSDEQSSINKDVDKGTDGRYNDSDEWYDAGEILGISTFKTIQIGMFDREDGSIKKIKLKDGKVYFYWNFYDYGWYTRDELCCEAKDIVDGIKDDEIIRRIKSGTYKTHKDEK